MAGPLIDVHQCHERNLPRPGVRSSPETFQQIVVEQGFQPVRRECQRARAGAPRRLDVRRVGFSFNDNAKSTPMRSQPSSWLLRRSPAGRTYTIPRALRPAKSIGTTCWRFSTASCCRLPTRTISRSPTTTQAIFPRTWKPRQPNCRFSVTFSTHCKAARTRCASPSSKAMPPPGAVSVVLVRRHGMIDEGRCSYSVKNRSGAGPGHGCVERAERSPRKARRAASTSAGRSSWGMCPQSGSSRVRVPGMASV